MPAMGLPFKGVEGEASRRDLKPECTRVSERSDPPTPTHPTPLLETRLSGPAEHSPRPL